ncbi:hypothetical protein FRB90_005426 [Tulasnella sp. 427]|nr:hypothetical protein FRB90_005426 [Tulasnella sp. 427]
MSSGTSTSPLITVRKPTDQESVTTTVQPEIVRPDGLKPTESGLTENESLVQPGLRLSDIADELEGDLADPDETTLILLSGGYADVFQSVWTSPTGEKIDVAVKKLRAARPSSTSDLKKRIDIVGRGASRPGAQCGGLIIQVQRMKRETLVWTRAKHKNIHPLLGFRSQPDPRLISPWCRHGNLIDYLHSNETLSDAAKLTLILQAGQGLAYLHSQNPPICHADIKPENVLVNDSCEAALSDFGLSRVLQSLDTRTGLTTSGPAKGTHCYMAPELFIDDVPRANRESDVYAFGGLILRVMSGKAPFQGIAPGAVLLRVMQGSQPEKAAHPKLAPEDHLWDLLYKCWEFEPEQRPTMEEVVAEIKLEVERRTS